MWFGLYGRFPVAVTDPHLASIFGAGKSEVQNSLNDLDPVFSGSLPGHDASARLSRQRVDFVMITARDRAWSQSESWVWTTPAAYASVRVRVLQVDRIVTVRAGL